MEKTVIIARALPGAGKTTMCKALLSQAKEQGIPNASMYSTDDYFIDEDGSYNFDGRLLHSAHQWNFSRFQRAVDRHFPYVIVDNTNIQFWECLNYVEYSLRNWYTVLFREPTTAWKNDIEQLLARNTHGVPKAAIERMLQHWDTTEQILNSFNEKYGNKVMVNYVSQSLRRASDEW